MRSYAFLVLIALMPAMFAPAAAHVPVPGPDETIGLLSKTVLDVSRKEVDKEWVKAHRGETLASGDRVKTGERSVAIIKFKDNSLVRVRELSELTVTGTEKGTAFSKSVEVRTGVVGFNIQKQRTEEEFHFTSPTSVASIRGTGGLFSASEVSDTLVVTEGSILLTNRISSRALMVEAGFTGVSQRDGSLDSHPTTSGERRSAEEAMSNDQQKTLELELRDGQGKTRQLRIDMKE